MIDDLLGLDLGPTPTNQTYQSTPQQPPTGGMDLLSGGLDQLLDFGGGAPAAAPPAQPMNQNPMGGGLLDILGGPTPAPVNSVGGAGLDALGSMGLFGGPAVTSNKVGLYLYMCI